MQKKAQLLSVLALGLLVALGAGCRKKPPKGAHEMQQQGSQTAPHEQMTPTLSIQQDGTMKLGPLMTKLPEGWKSVPPASSMRRAQFSLPSADGNGQPGEMTVFYFGPKAGGVDANIQRWISQFQQANGQPLTDDQVTRTDFTVNGLPISMVRFYGTQKPSTMPGMAATPAMTGWMNISGIVSTPDGPWFFKGTGPQKTMESQISNIETFLQGMKYVGAQHG